mgnify:CR=1 FL=1
MNDIRLDAAYRKKHEIVGRDIAGERLLVPVSGRIAELKRIFALSTVAGFIWDRIDGRMSLKDIHGEILDRFGVEPDEAGKDLDEFINQLLQLDLIERIEIG